MTNLDCTVMNCYYNKDKSCCKEGIMIEGSDAKNSRDTCCGSFKESTGDCACNAVEQVKKSTDIVCKACDCSYNEEKKCHAGHIGVAGSNACCCKETECMTFRCK